MENEESRSNNISKLSDKALSDQGESATSLTSEELELLKKEEEILTQVTNSLITQEKDKTARLALEGARSRELTSQLVAATRDEDKAMLASDEAVSHALRDMHSDDAKELSRLIKKPYFARFVLEEEDRGRTVQLEYKLGFVANPECRIIDWRKSPLSKIYYEYKEGEEFAENIQGREREGEVILRHPVQIEDGELQEVTCRFGTFRRNEDGWSRSRSVGSPSGGIKDVLPLITPEQFQTITVEARTAILIQGVAGSGKTTVALHRLAWLLHENNSDLSPNECAVIVRSEILARYIRLTLDAIEGEDVPVFTYEEWIEKVFKEKAPELELVEQSSPPKGLLMLRHSEQFFLAFEQELKNAEEQSEKSSFTSIMKATLLRVSADQPNFLNQIGLSCNDALEYYDKFDGTSTLPREDMLAFLRYIQSVKTPLHFKHLVVDELQDFSLLGLATLIRAVKDTKDLTLVGDVSQALSEEYAFVGWNRLKEVWKIEEGEEARFVTLEVSHRSSLQIMQLAAHIADQSKPTQGRQGRVPIWFHTAHEQDAIASAIKWLETASVRYASSITGVLCRNNEQAAQLYSLLKPTFGPTIRLGKRKDFSFDAGIVVASIDDVKGIEFTNVLLWNPSKRSYPKHDKLSKNRLYVGITRAEENLCMVTYGRYSGLLPSIHSKIVRGYDFRDQYSEERV